MFDIGEYKPSIWAALLFFLYAILVIPFAKFVFAKWPVPGLSNLVGAI